MMTPALRLVRDEPLASPRATVTPALLVRIRGEYQEMPGLRLTLRQAMRLFSLDALSCDIALRTLVEDGTLIRTRHGAFVRAE
jgi:hypothetical protein